VRACVCECVRLCDVWLFVVVDCSVKMLYYLCLLEILVCSHCSFNWHRLLWVKCQVCHPNSGVRTLRITKKCSQFELVAWPHFFHSALDSLKVLAPIVPSIAELERLSWGSGTVWLTNTKPWRATLIFSPGWAIFMTDTHAEIMVKGQVVQALEWKCMDGRTWPNLLLFC